MKKFMHIAAGVAALTATFASQALAATGVAKMTGGWGVQLNSLMTFGVIVFIFIGFVIFAISLYGIYKHFSNPQAQSELNKPIMGLVVGSALMAITAFVAVGQETVTGDPNSSGNISAGVTSGGTNFSNKF